MQRIIKEYFENIFSKLQNLEEKIPRQTWSYKIKLRGKNKNNF